MATSEPVSLDAATLYPNPENASVTVQLSTYFQFANIRLIDVPGTVILTQDLHETIRRITTGHLSPGRYVALIEIDGVQQVQNFS